jgi:hypothetical protein
MPVDLVEHLPFDQLLKFVRSRSERSSLVSIVNELEM